jgi:hypothetical protein
LDAQQLLDISACGAGLRMAVDGVESSLGDWSDLLEDI